MSAKEVFYRLRMKNGPSLDAPVEKLFMTRKLFQDEKTEIPHRIQRR